MRPPRGWRKTPPGRKPVKTALVSTQRIGEVVAHLRDALAEGAPARELAQAEQLVDVWTSLFFGVGVIWTAIGMRAALLEAIGPGSAGGDWAAMLARLVDGGILLSLMLYLMRASRPPAASASSVIFGNSRSSDDIVSSPQEGAAARAVA